MTTPTSSTPTERPDIAHGTRFGYKRAMCRCDECRRWHRNDTAAQKARRYLREPHVHGRASTYENWGCRCEPCTQAKAVKNG